MTSGGRVLLHFRKVFHVLRHPCNPFIDVSWPHLVRSAQDVFAIVCLGGEVFNLDVKFDFAI